jgi:hypothetical protein
MKKVDEPGGKLSDGGVVSIKIASCRRIRLLAIAEEEQGSKSIKSPSVVRKLAYLTVYVGTRQRIFPPLFPAVSHLLFKFASRNLPILRICLKTDRRYPKPVHCIRLRQLSLCLRPSLRRAVSGGVDG